MSVIGSVGAGIYSQTQVNKVENATTENADNVSVDDASNSTLNTESEQVTISDEAKAMLLGGGSGTEPMLRGGGSGVEP